MDRDEAYILPISQKRILNRGKYIIYSILCSIIVLLICDVLLHLYFSGGIGYIPFPIAVIVCDLCCAISLGQYIYKHDFAYGAVYEKYHIFLTAICGIQGFLKALLVMLIISILVVPVYMIFVLVIALWTLRKIFGRGGSRWFR